MSVWREVQEALYGRFVEEWAGRTPFTLANEDGFDPPAAPWCRVVVRASPGGQGTLGRPGARRWDRVGRLFVMLREPPGGGVGSLSDLAEAARRIFEGRRFGPHDVRFGVVDVGEEAQIEDGRWWGVTIDGRFEYEETA